MFGENEEFQSIHILFMSFIFFIIYFVWKSTEVRREIQPIENIQHTFGVRRSASIISNASTISTSTIEENLTNSVEELAQNIFTEASETYNNNIANNRSSNDSLLGGRRTDDDLSEDELSEEERIIREMDGDLNPQLRNRHQRSITRDNEASTSTTRISESTVVEDKISIKLKYLNDEIKTVECFLNESVGNFKRRNFKTELESKLIKLIFNGKLLEDDSKSIQQCGIFSEATVHCLIVQKKSSNINASSANPNIANGSNRNGASDTNNSLINNFNIAGIFLVTLTLIFCWYCRVQYASYFSWYSTIGLILMTSLFIILIPLFSMVFS
ncbi:unnamed protein product [Chironomus riparius]|uniref:Ubiquitin-like domain-containing protein n=1 Tax=Chironomus riparius TaxID=315576 RepID=A0A9N9WPH4_9DIPT|nr:unnamed protein product [Chironomus riparius]